MLTPASFMALKTFEKVMVRVKSGGMGIALSKRKFSQAMLSGSALSFVGSKKYCGSWMRISPTPVCCQRLIHSARSWSVAKLLVPWALGGLPTTSW